VTPRFFRAVERFVEQRVFAFAVMSNGRSEAR
jgi:hypothetical protein